MKSKFKFYTKINRTIVNCYKIISLKELIVDNFDELVKHINEGDLPMKMVIEPKLFEKINDEVASVSSSRYYTECIKVYINQTISPVIEIRRGA